MFESARRCRRASVRRGRSCAGRRFGTAAACRLPLSKRAGNADGCEWRVEDRVHRQPRLMRSTPQLGVRRVLDAEVARVPLMKRTVQESGA